MSELHAEPGAIENAPDLAGQVAAGEVAAAAPVIETSAAPPVDPLEMQAELEHMRQQYVQLAAQLEAGTQQPQAAAAPSGAFDPSRLVDEFGQLNPAALVELLTAQQQGLAQFVDQRFQQIQEPIAAQQQAAAVAQGEERLTSMLADDIARNGDFPRAPGATESKAQQLVKPLARVLFPQVQERFGATPRAAEIAMSRAASMVREIINEAQTAGANAETNRLAVLADARHEAGGAAVGVQGLGEVKARDIDEGLSLVSARYRDRLRSGT